MDADGDAPGPRMPEQGPAPAAPEAAAPETVTGEPRVDEAISRLGDLAELPVAEHPAVYEYVHQRLADALGDLDARPEAPGRPDGRDSAAVGGASPRGFGR